MLFAVAWNAMADEITGMTLTISHNHGEFFDVSFPAKGWDALDLTDESSTSIRIKRIEVQTSGNVGGVCFKATMYKTENGLRPDDEWRTFKLMQEDDKWVLDFGDDAPDLIDSEMRSSPRTFQFFVLAQDGSGNEIYYNNGGQDYKVLFVKGSGSQSSDGIKNVTLTIRHNGGQAFSQSFPAEGWQELILEERTTSLIIEKVEVEADESASDVEFYGTMYSTSSGGPSGNEWRSFLLENRGDGNWVLDMGEGIELVESKWLTENKTKTFQFYVKAQDGSNNDIYYNNGGEDYKVTFSTGESSGSDAKIQFVGDNAATIVLRANNDEWTYAFDGNGNRYPDYQPGQVNSLSIEQFSVRFSHADGVAVNDVSLQYKLYEKGHADEAWWNRLDAMSYNYLSGNVVEYYANKVDFNVTNGLETGKEYVLEVMFQVVVADGEYFFLAKGSEGGKFRFSRAGGVQAEGIRSFSLTIECDGEVFTESFPAEGWQARVIDGQTSSIKIWSVEIETSESMTYAGFCSTIYDAEDLWQHDDGAWDWVNVEYQGKGIWSTKWQEGKELIESEWIGQDKTKTFEFFAQTGDANGNAYYYANGIGGGGYYNNYKVTFFTGGGDDAIGLTPASLNTNVAAYNLAGQRVGKDYKGIVVDAGKKVLRK